MDCLEGWAVDFQKNIEALWAGEVKFIETDAPIGYRKTIGYIEHGKEVMFNEQPEGIHVG
jgi:hypothetical protein